MSPVADVARNRELAHRRGQRLHKVPHAFRQTIVPRLREVPGKRGFTRKPLGFDATASPVTHRDRSAEGKLLPEKYMRVPPVAGQDIGGSSR